MTDIKQGAMAFYIGDSQEKAIAIIRYKQENDGIIVAYSTYVDPVLRGQHIAQKLLNQLVDFARENHLKIRPTCSYVVKAFERDATYSDIAIKL